MGENLGRVFSARCRSGCTTWAEFSILGEAVLVSAKNPVYPIFRFVSHDFNHPLLHTSTTTLKSENSAFPTKCPILCSGDGAQNNISVKKISGSATTKVRLRHFCFPNVISNKSRFFE